MGQFKNGSDPTDRPREKAHQKPSRSVFPGESFVTLPLRSFDDVIFSDDRLRGKAIHDAPPPGAGVGDVADRPVDSDSADWYVPQSGKPRRAVAPETLFLWERRQ